MVDVGDGVLADELPFSVPPDFLDSLPLVAVAGLGDEPDAPSRPRLVGELYDLFTASHGGHRLRGCRSALRRGTTRLDGLRTAFRVLNRHSFTGHAQYVPSTPTTGDRNHSESSKTQMNRVDDWISSAQKYQLQHAR